MKYFSCFIALLLLVVLPGCGFKKTEDQLAEAYLEQTTGMDVNVDSSSDVTTFSMKGDDGQTTLSSSTELPSEYPDDVPYYQGTIINAQYSNLPELSFSTCMLVIETEDQPQEVLNFYKQNFSSLGWSQIFEMTDPETDMQTLLFTKGEDQQVTVAVEVKEGITSITHSFVVYTY